MNTLKIEFEAEKLDFNSQEVSTNNLEQLINHLTSLKGDSLKLQENKQSIKTMP